MGPSCIGLVPLEKGLQGAPSPLLPCGDTVKTLLSINWEGVGPSQDAELATTLILDSQASRTEKNKFVLFLSYPVYGILLQQPKLIKTDFHLLNGHNETAAL